MGKADDKPLTVESITKGGCSVVGANVEVAFGQVARKIGTCQQSIVRSGSSISFSFKIAWKDSSPTYNP